jgi:hypothetical protein
MLSGCRAPSEHRSPGGLPVKCRAPTLARWTRFNRRLAEEHGIPWGIWSFAPIFTIYDQQADTFQPDLLAALID